MQTIIRIIKVLSVTTTFIVLSGCATGGGSGGGYDHYNQWDVDHHYRQGIYNNYHYRPGRPMPPANLPDRPRPPTTKPMPRPTPRPMPRAR
jgi:hypothetical protein